MHKTIQCFLFAFGLIYAQPIVAQQSSLEEFNKTFPPAVEVKVALDLINTVLPEPSNSLTLFKKRYINKLEHRVFACSQFQTNEESDLNKIQALNIKLNDCLKLQDEQLLELIGVSLVSFRFTQPPLRPLVKLGQPFLIQNPEGMQVISGLNASKSGVAVLRYDRGQYASYQIPSGKKMANLPVMPNASTNASSYSAALSPNGRISAIRDGSLSFIDNETGQQLWIAKGSDFYTWFPEIQAALISRRISGENKLVLLDFKKGEIAPYDFPNKNQSWTLPISELPSRFLIGSYGNFSLVENILTPTGVKGKIIKDYKLEKSSVTSGRPILMQNGKSIFFRSSLGRDNDFLTLFNIKSGQEKLFHTGKFLDKVNYAKLNENELLVVSYDRSGRPKPWAFNVKNVTLSPIEADEFWGIVSGLEARIGFMRREGKGMWIGDELKIGKPITLASLVTADKVGAELTVLEDRARHQGHKSDSTMGYGTEIAEKRAQLIGKIPSNAKVEAIGVYQGKHNGTSRNVNVTIKRTRKPLILLLSSYSRFNWNLIKEPGANLVAIIVTSYEDSRISGAGETKTIVRKGGYAYEKNSPEYTALNNDALLWTGMPISKFQGEYEGDSFSVGD